MAQNLVSCLLFSRNLATPELESWLHFEMSIAVSNLHDLESSKRTSLVMLVELRFSS